MTAAGFVTVALLLAAAGTAGYLLVALISPNRF
ncbi:potassium-transporting ATPase subunit F [Gordonia sp. PP30]|nr:potassium-transporting ATPase subunit F [Gordonia sp. PP30]UQE76849.1 potassium-transporting ATPase subunit F [Gordonia sp. PP30]